MTYKNLPLIFFELLFSAFVCAQPIFKKAPAPLAKENIPVNTQPAYKWWNLLHYDIGITPDYNTKTITGANSIQFSALQAGRTMRIDLQEPMHITSATWKNSPVSYKREKDAYLLTFPQEIKKNDVQTIIIHFEGQPRQALKPPFDNGWIWASDKKGRPWMSVACEGSGASIWLPCKDVLYDEPDNGVSFNITIPDSLIAVANGRLRKKWVNENGTTTYSWRVVNPINSYNIIPYIGKYITWHKDYAGIRGQLDCDYWVLDYSVDKAKSHFKQSDTMLRAFEYWLGPYPFYEDSYKLVEAPMPGMEHQSAVAYGNGFENGYSGKDISQTGWGFKWDFIIVHESGHEWFGNSITTNNHGDTWIHEGFTKYLEVLYTSYVFGTEAGNEYAIGIWKRIKNDLPVIGTGTTDQYYKSSAMLHIIRQLVGDKVFRGWLTELNHAFYHQTVNTEQILSLLNNYTRKDFTKIFDQYLRTTQVPVLEYFIRNNVFQYRWSNCKNDFSMPVKVSFDSSRYNFIYPTTQWQKIVPSGSTIKTVMVDKSFYISSKAVESKWRIIPIEKNAPFTPASMFCQHRKGAAF